MVPEEIILGYRKLDVEAAVSNRLLRIQSFSGEDRIPRCFEFKYFLTFINNFQYNQIRVRPTTLKRPGVHPPKIGAPLTRLVAVILLLQIVASDRLERMPDCVGNLFVFKLLNCGLVALCEASSAQLSEMASFRLRLLLPGRPFSRCAVGKDRPLVYSSCQHPCSMRNTCIPLSSLSSLSSPA